MLSWIQSQLCEGKWLHQRAIKWLEIKVALRRGLCRWHVDHLDLVPSLHLHGTHILAQMAKVLENALKALYFFNNVEQQKWFVFNTICIKSFFI